MDLSAFHFLRPAWLLAVLPALWLWWRLLKRQHPLGNWAQVMEGRFARLFIADQQPPQRWPIHGLLALWIISALALAGPTWIQKPIPAHKVRTGVVIVFDLSLSMLAQDIKPSRLQRARYKVEDLIKRHPAQRFGLVAYAGSAHVITPLAEDSATLLKLLPSLNPMIMPKLGSRPDLGMEAAHRLFQGAQVQQGHIIWITDDLDHQDALERFFSQHGYTLAILAVGTTQGAPIPLPNGDHLKDKNGHTIFARLNWDALKSFAQNLNATLTPITLDDTDIERLTPPFAAAQVDDQGHPVTQWQDMGPYLVVLIALLGVFVFRRGWVFVLLPVLLLPAPPSVQAEEKTLSDWRDLFRTPDQQGYIQWQQQHYGRACDLFENLAWKGIACAKAGRTQAALRALEKIQDKSARDWYNLGTLLAQQGQLKAAEKALQQALQQQPNFPQARDNLHWVRQQLNQRQTPPATIQPKEASRPPTAQQLPQAATQTEKEQTVAQNSQKTAKMGQKAEKPPKSQQNPSQNRAAKSAAQKNRGTPMESTPSLSMDSVTTQTKPAMNAAGPEGQQAPRIAPAEQKVPQNWLQLIPDNPGLFLQRKFEYQLQQQPQQRQEDKTW